MTSESKGKVTIPKAVRQQLGPKQDTRVALVVEGDPAVLRPAMPQRAAPTSGFGMVKVKGPALPADLDVAGLLKPGPNLESTNREPKAAKRGVNGLWTLG